MQHAIEHDVDFQTVLAEQLRRAPWLLISLAAHVLVACFILLILRIEPDAPPPLPPPPLSANAIHEDAVEETLPEPTPVEEVVTEKVTEETTVVSEDSEFTLDEKQGEDGDSEAYEGGEFNFAGAGIGGGRGTRRGWRIGGHRTREASGSRTTQVGVSEGLRWLADHQSADGRWDADEFDQHCTGAVCTGAGSSVHDVGLTGLALLAFLGDGHHPNRRTLYQRTVRSGVQWLVSEVQSGGEDDGLIGGRKGHAFLYDHALASLALCEAYLLSQQENLREPAQRSIQFILRARNPYKAWRYEAPPNGENDSSITGWMVFALKTAHEAGLDIDRAALEGALLLFDELSDVATGRCGYLVRGELPARPADRRDRYPAANSESLTAVALLCRLFLGQTPQDLPILEAHADLIMAKLPQWDPTGAKNDFYYWYYASFAMFQFGGERWARWNEKLKATLLKNQRRDDHAKGSWDPNDPWGEDGGRIYSTALSVLCLEVYYRYAPISARPK